MSQMCGETLHSNVNIWELVRSTNASTLATWGAGYYIKLDRYIQHSYGALNMVYNLKELLRSRIFCHYLICNSLPLNLKPVNGKLIKYHSLHLNMDNYRMMILGRGLAN
jgi:hypothetical protein